MSKPVVRFSIEEGRYPQPVFKRQNLSEGCNPVLFVAGLTSHCFAFVIQVPYVQIYHQLHKSRL